MFLMRRAFNKSRSKAKTHLSWAYLWVSYSGDGEVVPVVFCCSCVTHSPGGLSSLLGEPEELKHLVSVSLDVSSRTPPSGRPGAPVCPEHGPEANSAMEDPEDRPQQLGGSETHGKKRTVGFFQSSRFARRFSRRRSYLT